MSSQRIEVNLTRKELYEKVWATPMLTLAKEYGLSDVGLAKICRKHNIPRPPVGYWQKLAFGKMVTRPPLPKRKDGVDEEIDITGYIYDEDEREKARIDYSAVQPLLDAKRQPENQIGASATLSRDRSPFYRALPFELRALFT